MDWWRAHHGLPYDSKLAVVAKRSKAKRGDVCAIWVACLDFASQREDRGSLFGMDPEEIAASLEYELETVTAVLTALREKGAIVAVAIEPVRCNTEPIVCNSLSVAGVACNSERVGRHERIAAWDRRQPIRERQEPEKTSTARSREHRARKKQQKHLANSTAEHLQPTNEPPNVGTEQTHALNVQLRATPSNAKNDLDKTRTEEIRTEEKKEHTPPTPCVMQRDATQETKTAMPSPRAPQVRWKADRVFVQFVNRYLETGAALVEEEFSQAFEFCWKKLDYEQKADRVRALEVHFDEYRENPRFVKKPLAFLETEWKRPIRPPARVSPVAASTVDRLREGVLGGK